MATEQTPLISVQDDTSVLHTGGQDANQKPVKRQTPLPKVQLFAMLLIQFCEPVTATVIYPFVVSLVNETGTQYAYKLFCEILTPKYRCDRWGSGEDGLLCWNYRKWPYQTIIPEALTRTRLLGISFLCSGGLDCFCMGPSI